MNIATERKTQKARKVKAAIANTDRIFSRDHLGDWLAHPWNPRAGVRMCIEGNSIVIEELTPEGNRRCMAKLQQSETLGFRCSVVRS